MERYRRASFDRKPSPGLLLKAQDEFGIAIGKPSDMEAAFEAGVASRVLITRESHAAGHKQVFLRICAMPLARCSLRISLRHELCGS